MGKQTMRRMVGAAALAVCVSLAVPTRAATVYWSNDSTDGLWNTGSSNWRLADKTTVTTYADADVVWFGAFGYDYNPDFPAGGTIAVQAAGVSPTAVTFQRGFGATYTLTGGDILTGSITHSRDQWENFDRDGSYSFGGGVTIASGGQGMRYQPSSGGAYQFGTGAITFDGGGAFQFNPGAAATLSNNFVVNTSSAAISSANGNGTFSGTITMNTGAFAIPSPHTLVVSSAQGIILTQDLRITGYSYPNGATLDAMVTGPGHDLILGVDNPGGTPNADWTFKLAGTGGWSVDNVSKGDNKGALLVASPTNFFDAITGKVIVPRGVLMAGATYQSTAGAAPTYTATSEYEIQAEGTLRANTLNVTQGGTVGGAGTVQVSAGGVNVGTLGSAGILSPGASAATITISGGSLTLGPNAALKIELGSDSVYDVVTVSGGNAVLGGTLQVWGLGGFTPAPTDTFTILSASSVSGSFSNLVGGTVELYDSITSNLAGWMTVTAGADAVTLSNFLQIPEPGTVLLLGAGLVLSLRRRNVQL